MGKPESRDMTPLHSPSLFYPKWLAKRLILSNQLFDLATAGGSTWIRSSAQFSRMSFSC